MVSEFKVAVVLTAVLNIYDIQPKLSAMEFIATPIDLSPWIQSIWTWQAAPTQSAEVLIAPDARCELVIHLGVPPLEWRDGVWQRQPRVFLYGQLRAPLSLHSDYAMNLLAVRFHPHTAACFFGIDGSDLQAMPIGFHDLSKLTKSLNWLGDSESMPITIASVVKALRLLAKTAKLPDAFTLLALKAISAKHGEIRIKLLAKQLAKSPRQFERVFFQQVGLAPKFYARIKRIQFAQALLAGPDVHLAEIANSAGFADQSHFNREAIALCGQTPLQLRANLSAISA